ncbi:plasmid mobilization protein [Burkholderia sp. WAC0059]|uniref:plasmid mobilization protein n=1 Tax=Burkholderia sp. WAC0059 TaxID=2066022 RepID=UPI0011AF61EA|nr:plasmid mobilization relaxosome protein MobC [Burkholderia sp. WAC0059]
MEQIQFDEAAAPSLKKQAGQSGADGNIYRRDRRVEIRFSNDERDQLWRQAFDAGYGNLAQYLRNTLLNGSAVSASKDGQAWLQTINRIGNYVAEIAGRLNEGQQPDDEILLVLMQVQEYAEDVWKAVKQGGTTETA